MPNGRGRRRSRKQKQRRGPTLPNELWAKVFSFCDAKRDWPAVSRVCRRWYDLGKPILDVFDEDVKTFFLRVTREGKNADAFHWFLDRWETVGRAIATRADGRSDDDWTMLDRAIDFGRGNTPGFERAFYLVDRTQIVTLKHMAFLLFMRYSDRLYNRGSLDDRLTAKRLGEAASRFFAELLL